MIGGRRPLQGRKPADRRVRVERPHSPYFRYTGRNQLVAKAAANQPRDRGRPVVGGRPQGRDRPAPRERGGGRRAPLEEEGARDLQLGRDQLVGLRDPGDHPGPRDVAGVAALVWSVPVAIAIAVLLAVVVDLLPPGLPGVPGRRRRLRGGQGEPEPDGRAGRRGRPPDRLRDDGRGLDRVGDRPDRVGRAGARRREDRDRGRRDLPDDGREPARPARVRKHLRDPDLRVRLPRPADGRDRALPHRHRPGPSDRHAERRVPDRRRAARSSCS